MQVISLVTDCFREVLKSHIKVGIGRQEVPVREN